MSDPLTFKLPSCVCNVVRARNAVRQHYAANPAASSLDLVLKFTLDGNFIGDLGEALAVEMFGITLHRRGKIGNDGIARDGKTKVQVKTTGTGRGPAFRQVEEADHLLFFSLDLELATGALLYNGPEHRVRDLLPKTFVGQRSLGLRQVIEADKRVLPAERLARLA